MGSQGPQFESTLDKLRNTVKDFKSEYRKPQPIMKGLTEKQFLEHVLEPKVDARKSNNRDSPHPNLDEVDRPRNFL